MFSSTFNSGILISELNFVLKCVNNTKCFFRKQTCSGTGCTIVEFLQGSDSCKTGGSNALNVDVIKDLKLDGNAAVLINAIKGQNGNWVQLVGNKWENIEAKVAQFTLDSSACTGASICVLVWDGTKLRAVMYSTKEIEITITTNSNPLGILLGGGSSTTETKNVKIQGFCQAKGTVTVPTGPQCDPVDCYPNANCIEGQCICKTGFSLYNNLDPSKIDIEFRFSWSFSSGRCSVSQTEVENC